MRSLFVFLFSCASLVTFAQCDGIRFREFTFPSFAKTAAIPYGQNANHDGSVQPLEMDVYEPAGDQEELRPLVIFAHGGFFVGGSRDGNDVVPLCQDLARMGYVTASITYRLGFPLNNLEARMTEAVLRGVHDMKAAIRWFRKSADEQGNPFRINTNEIYVGGISAGGYIALHLAYLDQEEEIPAFINFSNPGLAGGLEGQSGNADYSSEVKAIISIAGALGDTSWIGSGDEPAMLFHGNLDTTVPYDYAMQSVLGVIPVAMVHGSHSIAAALEENGVTHCFETHEGFNHVPHISSTAIYDTTLSMITGFLSYRICGDEFDCGYRDIPAEISEFNELPLQIYPNPATSDFRVEWPWNGPVEVCVEDLQGRTLSCSQLVRTDLFDVKLLPEGMYLVRVRSEELIRTTRLIVAR